jgi:hypothetical protein
VTVVTKGEAVQIQLWRDGVFVASWLDQSDGIYEGNQNGETLADHLEWGYYNTVTNWQAEWGRPITRAGSTGFRADNTKIWIDDFQVSSLATTNDSKIAISFQGGRMILNWIGGTLQSSTDLETWLDDDCAVSPLSITPVQMNFYRVKN